MKAIDKRGLYLFLALAVIAINLELVEKKEGSMMYAESYTYLLVNYGEVN